MVRIGRKKKFRIQWTNFLRIKKKVNFFKSESYIQEKSSFLSIE